MGRLEPDATQKALANAMLYGLCPGCGWPRTVETISHTDDNGHLRVTRGFVCTNPEPHEHGELVVP